MRHFPLSIDTEGVAEERARALMGAALVLWRIGDAERRDGFFIFDREELSETADDIQTGVDGTGTHGLRLEPTVQADCSSVKPVTVIPSLSG
jgi:hypothetical protein